MRVIPLIDDQLHLLEGLKRNEREAQKRFYEIYHKKMLSICFRYFNNEEDALDAMNRSFLKIFDKINQFKSEASLDVWIKRITINTCLDLIKKNKKYRQNFIHTDEFTLYGEPNEENELEDDNYSALLDLPADVIYELVLQLPPASRTVFNLYAIDGYSHVQIAEQLKISTGTSKWHLSNARKILSKKLLQLIKDKKNNINYENQQQ
jgi:RNA polymerase sigma-70 factor (ECF subfamily)